MNTTIYSSEVSSVIIIVIFRDKDVMLFQKSGEVLADQRSDIQERHHHYCHADQTKWGLEDNEGMITDIKNARNVKRQYIRNTSKLSH